MSPLRAVLPLLAVLAACRADLAPPALGRADLTPAALGRADLTPAALGRADLTPAALGRADLTPPAPLSLAGEGGGERREAKVDESPRFTGDALTDARDVRACVPLDGGGVLAGTGGGLLLVRADGTVRAPWTELDGLPETRVHALLRDGDRVWIGTEGGLAAARLHGEQPTVESALAGKPVRALALHDGALFAATWGGGIERLDERKGRLVRLRGHEDRFSALAEHEGTLFAGSPSGLHRVAGGAVTPVAGAPPSIWALAVHDGRLWVGGLTGLVSMAGGASRTESDADVRALIAGDGALLAGTFGRGAVELSGGRVRPLEGLAAPPFMQAVGASGSVRCAGGPGGLWVQRGATARWTEAPIPELGSGDLSALARDGDRLWIGTFDRGISVLDGDRVVRVRDAALDDKINALAVEPAPGGSRVWGATARGLARIEPGATGLAVTRFGELDGLPSSDVHAVVALAAGGVLVGTGRGAAIVDGGRVTALGEKHGLPPGAVWAVAEGPPGTLLLGTSRGLLVGTAASEGVVNRGAPRADDAGAAAPWVQLSMATGDLDDDWITALAVHGSRIYVGTYNAGVTVITRGKGGTFVAEQLGGGYVNMGGLLVEGGTLFAATMRGLLMRPSVGPGQWRADPRAAPGRDVTAVVPAGDHLWVGSRRGLGRFTPG